MTPAARLVQPRQWSGVVAWALWVLVLIGMAVGFWLEDLLRQAGWADPLDTAVGPTVAAVSAATVGAVLVGRRPRHPVGWLRCGGWYSPGSTSPSSWAGAAALFCRVFAHPGVSQPVP